MQGIYWIASYPRSGNTWTRGFLAALESIQAGRPPHGSLAGIWERTLAKGDISAAALVRRLSLQSKLAASRPGITLAKTHSARMLIDGYPTINPTATAGAVYLVRDPRDVAVSLAAMFNLSIDAAIARMGTSKWVSQGNEKFGFEVRGSWSENVHSWRRSDDTLVQRYEDIRAAPAKHFSVLVKHMGIDAEPTQIEEAVSASSLDRMQAAEQKRKAHGHVIQMVRVGKTRQWRGKLTRSQLERLEADHREEMEILGYL
jgi:hypothetical protein